MEELNELKRQQKKARDEGDFIKLSAINQKIFSIREQKRKERAKLREQELDNKTAEKIEKIMTL